MKKKKHASESTQTQAVEPELDKLVLFVSRLAGIAENPHRWPLTESELAVFAKTTIRDAVHLASQSFFKKRTQDANDREIVRLFNGQQ